MFQMTDRFEGNLQIALMAIVGAVAAIMLALERSHPGREFPLVKGWLPRAIWLNSVQFCSTFAAGLIWNAWFLEHRLWGAARLGIVAGGLLGYLVLTFVYYWWHLARHRSSFLWRWLHQIHHSAQRLELLTAFYKRPAEIISDSVISSALLYMVLGLQPLAGAFAMVLSGLGELFYHWNVRTPYWLGFLYQRPESHLLHHQEGLHDYNYSDLPLWDMLFGTFCNPREWKARCGLGPENEHRVIDMLMGIDVWRSNPAKPLH